MPANVSPEYKKAHEAFRKARDPSERLACLKEMLRTIPKHKGTEHLQADIKTRIKDLTTELAGPKKGGARTGPAHTVRPEGAAQIVLVGPPNAGKSSLHKRLTGSRAEVGAYPNTTRAPLPGMLMYEDVHLQLVDLPPISADYMEPWMANPMQRANAALLVVDVNTPGCAENVAALREKLHAKRVSLLESWGGKLDASKLDVPEAAAKLESSEDENDGEDLKDADDPFRVFLPTLLVANKCDLNTDIDEIEALQELVGIRYPAIQVSAQTGEGLDRIGPLLFEGLDVVRVYTKIPGRKADTGHPYTVFRGDTVRDVALLVHRELAETLKFARIWGSGKFDGQRVGIDHAVNDGDVLELHG